MVSPVILDLRREYHKKMCNTILGYRPNSEVISIADSHSNTSRELAEKMVKYMGCSLCQNPETSQTAGKLFSQYTKEFIEASFLYLQHIRPGEWLFSVSQAPPGIAAFEQYEHLEKLQKLAMEDDDLKAILGVDYLITPDIIVARYPLSDEIINEKELLVDQINTVSTYTPLRSINYKNPRPILHASISCKWTMRSDRAQNTRTEALNLIRNRKGNTPHIVAVTLEPMPSRLSSIALGTGDVDCTYHAALYELMKAVKESKNEDQAEILESLVSQKRLRDISDLPFDLAI